MLGDLFEADNIKAASDLALRPPPVKAEGAKFSAWNTLTAAPRGVAAGAAQSTGFAADVLGAFGQVGGAIYSGDLLGNMPEQQRKETEQASQQMRRGLDFSSEAGDSFRGVARGYSPDPSSAHTAERLVFDFARFGSKAVGYMAGGGPVVGGLLVAGDEGMAAADDLKQQGVDLATRTKAGAVIGAVSGLSVALPMAGRTAVETAALVAAGGPLSFIGQQAAVRSILQAADYSKLGEQYDPFDPVGLAVSTLVPAAFGVHGLRVNKAAAAAARAAEDFRAGPVPSAETPTAAAAREATGGRAADEHVDAARTLLAVEQRRESSPFRADDWRAHDVHETALARAVDQMAAGEPVHVTDVLAAPDLSAARAVLDQIDGLQAERAQLLPDAAALAEPGAIREARAELRMMEQQRPDSSEISTRALAKEIQAQQQVSYKAALAEAKKQQDGAAQDFEARQARLNQSIEANARAQQATQRVGELDQRITTLEQQLGPEAKLARFDREITTNLRALAERTRLPERRTDAPAPAARETPAAPAKPAAADAPSAGRPAAPARADQGQGLGAAEAAGRLVEDGSAARVAQIELERPGLMVRLDGMDKPLPLSEVMKAIKAEADDLKLDGDLMQAAAECALLNAA